MKKSKIILMAVATALTIAVIIEDAWWHFGTCAVLWSIATTKIDADE